VIGLTGDDKWKPLGIIGVLYLGDACWLFITASILPTLSLNKDTVDLEENKSIFHTILEIQISQKVLKRLVIDHIEI